MSRPVSTCPSEILHAFTQNIFKDAASGKELKLASLPLIGCEKTQLQQKLLDGAGKDRNGIWKENILHPDEVMEYGRLSFYNLKDKPLYASLSINRYNTPMPTSMQHRWDERLLHAIFQRLGLLPRIYKTNTWPARTRTIHRELIQGVQGIVFDEDSL